MLEVFTFGGGDYIVNVLNAVSAWTGSGGWRAMIRVVLVIGFIYALLTVAFSLNWKLLFNWFLGATAMFGCLIVPTTTVQVTDRFNPSLAPSTVGDVPVGLALVAHLSSLAGDYLTRTAETVFVMPNSLKMTESGIIYGVRLYDRTQNFMIRDPRVRVNLSNYYENCLFYDFMLGRKSVDDVVHSPDMLAAIGPGAVSRAMPYLKLDLSAEIVTCQEAYNRLSGADIPGETLEQLQQEANKAFPGLTPALALAQLRADIPETIAFMHDGVAQNAEVVFRQRALTDVFLEARANFGDAMGDSFARQRAEAQVKNTYTSIAEQAMTWVPLLHIVLTAVFYAMFPVIFPLFLLPSTGVTALRGYMTGFFYLAAWGPLYVVLHMFVMFRNADALSAVAPDGITAAGMAGIDAVNVESATIAGSMMMAVPFIAAYMARGAMGIAGQATSMLAPAQGAAEAAATEQTTGNYSYGNVNTLNETTQMTQARQWKTAATQFVGSPQTGFRHDNGAVTTAMASGALVTDTSPASSRLFVDASTFKAMTSDRQERLENNWSRQEQLRNSISARTSLLDSLRRATTSGSRTENGATTTSGVREAGSEYDRSGTSSGTQTNVSSRNSQTDSNSRSTRDTSTGYADVQGTSKLGVGVGDYAGVSGRATVGSRRDFADSIENRQSTEGSRSSENSASLGTSAEQGQSAETTYSSQTDQFSRSSNYTDSSVTVEQVQQQIQEDQRELSRLESEAETLSQSQVINEGEGLRLSQGMSQIVRSRYYETAQRLGLDVVPPVNAVDMTPSEARDYNQIVMAIVKDYRDEQFGRIKESMPTPESMGGQLQRPADFNPRAASSQGMPSRGVSGGTPSTTADQPSSDVRSNIDRIRASAREDDRRNRQSVGAGMAGLQRSQARYRRQGEEDD